MTLRRLRSDDSGFSLIELLMAMALGSLVLTALLTVFMKGSASALKSGERTDALARGRVTMDRAVTLLSSEICLVAPNVPSGLAPIVDGQNNQVAFYASLGTVDSTPLIYRLRYDAANKRLYEDRYNPSVNSSTREVTYPNYPGSPAVSKLIGTNIVPSSPTTPIFKYEQFVTTEGPTLGMINGTPLPTPLDAAGRNAAVRLTVTFTSQPEYSKNTTPDKHGTPLQGTATVGSANAGEPTKGVNC